jgi:hypothetical protein
LYFHIGVWLLKVSWNGCFDIYPTLFPRTNIEMWNVSETTTPSYCIYWLSRGQLYWHEATPRVNTAVRDSIRLYEWQPEPLNRNESGGFGALKSDSTHHFFRNACTKTGSLRFSLLVVFYIFVYWLIFDVLILVVFYTLVYWLI